MSANAAHEAAHATIETGRVFQSGGIDGLILWALVLMGLAGIVVAIVAIIFGYRAVAKKDEACSADRKAFTDAANLAAEANRELAAAIASKNAADVAVHGQAAGHQAQLTAILARIEARLDGGGLRA